MDDDLKKLRKMTAFMRKQGLLRLKQGNIELELAPAALTLDAESPAKPSAEETPQVPEQPSADDLALGLPPGTARTLFWSSPTGLPDAEGAA